MIGVRLVKKPRRRVDCDYCGRRRGPTPAGPMLRLYGAPDTGDKPYHLWLCLPCDDEWTRTGTRDDAKIGEVREAAGFPRLVPTP